MGGGGAGSGGAGGSSAGGRGVGASGASGTAPTSQAAPRRRPQPRAPTVPDHKGKGPARHVDPSLTPEEDEDSEDTIPLAASGRRARTPLRPAPATARSYAPVPPSRGRPTPPPASRRTSGVTPPVSSDPLPPRNEPPQGGSGGGTGAKMPSFLRPASYEVPLGSAGYISCTYSFFVEYLVICF